MNPVVGLDISKGESQVQAFSNKGKPYRKSFKVDHTLEGLSSLVAFLENIKRDSGKKPSVILEATGHYQAPVVHYLEDRGYLLIILSVDLIQGSKLKFKKSKDRCHRCLSSL